MAKSNRIILAVLILGFLAGMAQSATWYVNCDTGVNTTEGGYGTSADTPWKNITYAATKSAVSDTIYVAAGTYNASTGESYPINLGALRKYLSASTYLATLDAGSLDVVTLGTGSTLEGFTVKSTGSSKTGVMVTGSTAEVNSCQILMSGSSSYGIQNNAAAVSLKINGCYIEAVYRGIYLVNDNSNTQILNNYVKNTDNNGKGIEIPYSTYDDKVLIQGNTIEVTGLSAYGIDGSLLRDFVIKNNTVKCRTDINYGYWGIYISNYSYGTIEANEIRYFRYNNTKGGIFAYPDAGKTLYINKNTIVRCPIGVSGGSGIVNAKNNIVAPYPKYGEYATDTIGLQNSGATFYSSYNDIFNCATNYSGAILDKNQDIFNHPRFVDPDINDYRLFSDSPCAGTADDGGTRGRYGSVEASSNITNESYVSESTGDDSRATSTPDLPWRTITRALGSTEGTVYARAGTYTTGESFPLLLVTGQQLKGYLTEVATVEESGSATRIFELRAGTTLEGLCLKGNGSDRIINVTNTGVHIKNNDIKADNYSYGIFSTKNNTTIEGNTIWRASAGQTGIIIAQINSYCNIYKNEIRGFSCGIQDTQSNGGSRYIDRNTLINNTTGVQADNVFGGTTYIKNNIICNNPKLDSDFATSTIGINAPASNVSATYNNVWKNASDYSGGVSAGTGSKSEFPGFASAEANDFRLHTSNAYWNNPCIGAGEGGVNMGCYDGSVETGVPYRTESYVREGGSDTTGDGTSEATAWRTLTRSNTYTVSKINAGAGTYNAGAGESAFPRNFSMGRYIKGADRNAVTIEAGSSQDVVYLSRNSTIESVTLKGSSGTQVIKINGTGAKVKDCLIKADGYTYGVYSTKSYTTIESSVIWRAGNTNYGVLIAQINNYDINRNEIRGFNIGINDTQGTSGGLRLIDRNAIVKNKYGVQVDNSSGATTIKNNIIAGEIGEYSAVGTKGIYLFASSAPTCTYNDIYFCDTLYDGAAAGTGSISRDAKFVASGEANEFHLLYNSPCIDSGDPVSSPDPDGSRADMGAYPFDQTTSATPSVYVITPNGGETLTGNSPYAITWYATYDGTAIDHIELYYSTDSGATFPNTIATNETNDGSFSWTVPNISNATARVRAIAVGSAGTDESDSDFTIQQALGVTLEAPNGGETWKAGTWHNLTWTAEGPAASFRLYFTTSEAAGYQLISGEVSGGATSYAWLVPNRATSEAKVRIQALRAAEIVTDESNAVFAITAATDFYVNASTGSNSYNGLTSEVSGLNGPWKTITWASTQAATSSTIRVAAGTYNAALGENFPITLTNRYLLATNTNLATIEETGSSNILMNLGANAVLDGLSLKGDGILYVLSLNGNTISIKNNIINADNYYSAVYSSGRSGISVEGNVIHSMERTGLQIESANNVAVSRNEIRDHGSDFYFALYATGQNINIERNTLVRNYKNLYAMASGGPINIKNNIISNKPQLNDDYALGCVGIQSGGGTINLSYNNVWKNYANYDTLSPGATDISDFPGFVSPEAGDYRLQASNPYWTNPCAGAGEGGVDIGCYGTVEAGVPYRSASYVNGSGNDSTGTGTSEGAAWRTLTRANKYTSHVINVGSGSYNAAGGETTFPIRFSIDRYIKGAGRDLATIEAGAAKDVAYLNVNSSIEGLTLKGGSGSCVLKIYGRIQLKNCFINAANYSYGIDGLNYLTYATIEGCRITSANADGILLNPAYAWIISNEVGSCTANGMNTYQNSLIRKNLVYNCNIGLYANETTEIDRNTIVKNKTGIYANTTGGRIINIKSNIVASEIGGYAAGDTKGIYSGFGTVNSSYNDAYFNDKNWDGVVSGEGDISRDPKLVNAASADYHLLHNSPCIDSGSPATEVDPDGSRADMGAYPYYQTTSATPCVYVKYPNGGENIAGGSDYTVTWSATHDGYTIDHIELYYSLNGGSTYPYTITANTANDGSHTWRAPNVSTTEAKIRIIAVGSAGTDESDSNFSILSTSHFYVDAVNGSNDYSGTTSEVSGSNGPWKTITWASTQAATSSTIRVAAGTYNAALGEAFTISLTGKKLLASTAGLATIEAGSSNLINLGASTTVEGFSLRSTTTNKVINITGANVLIKDNNLITSYSITSGDDLYAAAAGSYLTVQGNTIDSRRGNSLNLISGANNPVIRNNTITNTNAGGNGIYNWANTSITIEGNNIIADKGIESGVASGIFDIKENKISAYSGDTFAFFGMSLGGSGTVSSNEVRGYRNTGYAGIHVRTGGILTVNKNTVVKNLYGVKVAGGTVYVKNSIVSAAPRPGTFWAGSIGVLQSGGTAYSTYNQLFNNETTYSGTIQEPKTADLTTSPRFVNSDNNDYRLYNDSPCKGSADPAIGGNRGAYTAIGENSGITTESYVCPIDGTPAGDDSRATSSPDLPWATIDRALGSTEGTVYARAGTYNAAKGEKFSVPQPLTLAVGQQLRRYLTEVATIDSGTYATHTIVMSNNTTLEGLTIQSSTTTNDRYVVNVIGPNVRILNDQILQTATGGSGIAGINVGASGDNCLIQGNTVSVKGSYALEISGANNPIIRNNTISNTSTSVSNPKALYFTGACSSPTVEGNTLTSVAGDSYGIDQGSSCTNQDTRNNKVIGPGGNNGYYGISLSGSGTISSNEVRGWGYNGGNAGTAIYANVGGPWIIDKNTLVKNRMGVRVGVNMTIKNNIIACEVGGYSSSGTTYGINRSAGTITSTYNDIYAADNLWYGAGVASGEGDISRDPKFIDATGNDYHLLYNSPCIDSGDPASTKDPDGSRADMGAYPYYQTTSATPCVYVKTPNGGENITGGSDYVITWYSTDDGRAIDHIELYYSLDNGSTYPYTITANTVNDGSHTWRLPNLSTTEAKIKIIAVGSAGTDESDSKFSVLSTSHYYVDAVNGDNSYSGTTSEVSGSNGPWKTITWASTQAATSSTIHAAAGTYNTALGESFPINLGSNKNYIGAGKTLTTVEGSGSADVFQLAASVTVDAFHVKYTGNYKGIKISGSNAHIKNGKVSSNDNGDGIYFDGLGTLSGGKVSTCEINNCGSGVVLIYTNTSAVTIEGCEIYSNQYNNIYIYDWRSPVTIYKNIIRDCPCSGSPVAAIMINSMDGGNEYVTIDRNTIVRNKLGIYSYSSSSTYVTVKNNIIVNKPYLNARGDNGSYGFTSWSGGTFTNTYNDVWNNYKDYNAGSQHATEISAFPRFVNVANNDFRLYSGSPCLGAGESGVNMGAYDGAGEAGSPYRTISYVSYESGTDAVTEGGSWSTPYKTVTYANKYTERTINVGQGTYTTAETICLTADKEIKGVGSGQATLECTLNNKNVIETWLNSTIESITVKIKGDPAWPYSAPYGIRVLSSNNKINNVTVYSSVANCGTGIYFDGGGDTSRNTGGRVSTCEIYNCGSGIVFASSASDPVTIEGCDIHHNYVNNIYVSWASLVAIYKNIIRDCPNGSGGVPYAAIFISGMDSGSKYCTVEKNTIVRNQLGVYTYSCGSGYTNIINNIISNKPDGGTPDSGSYGIYLFIGSNSNSYNDVYNNTTNYYNCSAGTGAISVNPRLVNNSSNDFHLRYNSPCIDSGDPTSTPDPDSTRTDMGAYPYDQSSSATPCVYIKTPNGGESIAGGSDYFITWSATDDGRAIDHIELYYSLNNGATYPYTITASTPNDGSHTWRAPNVSTTEAKIRIIAVGSAGTDESDSNFSILSTSNFYVNASTGSNDYTGTTSEVSGTNGPWKTITWASTQAATGTAINVAAGTYNTALGESFPILLTGKKLLSTTTHMATIEEDSGATSILNLGDNTTLEGFCLKGNGTDKMINVSGSSVIIKGNQIDVSGYGNGGIAIPGSSNITIEANILHSAGNVAIYSAAASNVRIYKNEVRNCSGTGVFLYGNGMVVDRNTIVKNSANVYVHPFASNVTIKNNIISNQPVLDDDQVASSYGISDSGVIASLGYNNVWKNDSDYSGTSAGVTDISRFPGFVSPEANDYRLQASNAYWTNPCIGAGEGGVNIGAYDSTDAGVPYRTESYVSGTGNDLTGNGTSEGTAWRTLTRANKYTVSKINAGTGLYNAANGESDFPRNFSINRYIKGADRNTATIEAGAQIVAYLNNDTSIEGVTLKGGGGGSNPIIEINGDRVIIKNNIFNAAGYYYGIYSSQYYTTIEANIMYSAARGIFISGNARIYQNEIRNCGVYAIGIYSTGTCYNNTLVGNQVGIYGGISSGGFGAKNNIISDGIFGIQRTGGAITSSYNDVYANFIDWSGCTSGEGDISRDPKYIDIASNDFHLSYNSPCIDSGDPASTPDPDGSRADMGCYPYDQTTSATPCVYVKTPNGGEIMTGLNQYTITWSATDDGRTIDHIELYYSIDSGATYPYTIDNNTPNDGSYLWTVGNTPTIQARVRVIAVGSAGIDESDGDFIILQGDATPPTVEVVSPNGGEKWKGSSTHDITFTCTDEYGIKPNSANFYYSTGEGTSWITINTGQPTNTAYSWNPIPSISTTEVKIRVTVQDNNNITGTDESNAVFTIDSTPPTVNVLIPNGGDKWIGGVNHNITWTATDNFTLEVNPITLQYSVNSGTDYTNIITQEANDGIYNWPTPSLNTNEAKVKILAIDQCGNIGSDESNTNFIIDITPPGTSELITPPNSSITNDATPYFSWNAATDNLSGIASYEIWIDSVSVTQDATTSYTTPDAMTEGVHTWKVKARDGAGWWGVYSVTYSFTVDLSTPEVSSITLRDRTSGNTQYTNELAITVEANGVTGSPAQMRMAQDAGFTQNDSGWIAYTNPATYEFTAGEGSRTVYYKLRDAGLNESETRNNNIIVDTIAPSVESITLKDITTGSTIESNELTVTVEATGVSAESVSMRIAQNITFTENTTGWITYVNSTRYIFTVGDGLRTAYYQVRDPASNESNNVYGSITLDTGAPTCEGIILKDRRTGSTSYSSELTITVEAQTVYGTPEGMRLAQNSTFTENDTGWITYANPTEYTLTAGEGSRMVYFKMRDAISNESPAYSDNINVDLNAPTIEVITPNGGERLSGLGGTFNVQWNASDAAGLPPNPIALRYSTDSGVNWTPIAAGQPNTPPYLWTVPTVNSVNCRVSVEVEDYIGRKAADMSNADFIIDSTRPTIISVTPTSGAASVLITSEVTIVFSQEMSREATESAFDLSASPGVAGAFTWSADSQTLTFKPSAALSYNTLYHLTVGTGACNLTGNGLAAAYASSFTTELPGDTEKPHVYIQVIDGKGRATTLKEGDYLSPKPKFKGVISDDQAINRSSIKFYLDDLLMTSTVTEINTGKYEVVYDTVDNLADERIMSHKIKVEARDLAGNLGEKVISELKVSYAPARVVGPVLTYPQTFKPLTGQTAKIAYNLSADSDIVIYMFDTSGQNVWTGKYFSGEEGGRAGYNEVEFRGTSQLTGGYLGNGVYVYKIIRGEKILGTGYVTIFE